MTAASAVLFCVPVILLVTTEVTSWTLDLPEARRYYFEKFSRPNAEEPKLNDDQIFYDNINPDILHNTDRKQSVIDYFRHYEKNLRPINEYTDDPKSNVYANGYHHDIYMVKKVSNGLIANGPSYLEGLRLAIERYTDLLKNCSNNDLGIGLPPNVSSSSPSLSELCRQATETSEQVRRLADLALHATTRLQDVSFSAKYSKDASMEENELLLRLAWYLDKLAYLTGYEPSPEELIPETPTRPPTTTLPVPNLLNITDEEKLRILQCLKEKSDVPATERCAFPNPVAFAEQINRVPVIPPQQSPPTTDTQRSPRTTNVPSLEREILVATDNRGIVAPTLTAVSAKSERRKRSTDENDPLVKLLKYYAKYKTWELSNSNYPEVKSVDVSNRLHKRSVAVETRKPDTSFGLSKRWKNGKGLDQVTAKLDLDRIYAMKLLPARKLKNLEKSMRQKRSYVNSGYIGVVRPRVPTDPQIDLSYYVKNKRGTNRVPNVAQAALVRAALEGIYQRGNINVVHRYGANFNPAVPAPLLAGFAKSTADV